MVVLGVACLAGGASAQWTGRVAFFRLWNAATDTVVPGYETITSGPVLVNNAVTGATEYNVQAVTDPR